VTTTFTLRAGTVARANVDLIAVPVFADRVLGPGADAIADGLKRGEFDKFLVGSGFEGKPGQTALVPTGALIPAPVALVIGLGAQADLTLKILRRAGAAIARAAKKSTSVATTLLDAAPESLNREAAAQALVEGIALGGYQFLDWKSKGEASKLTRVEVLGRGGAKVQTAIDRAATVADAVSWARDIVNQPAAVKSPVAFAAAAKKRCAGAGVTVTILDVAEMKKERLGGVLGVGQGSAQPPRFVKITYTPPRAKGFLALVGKGVVFDSGGLSLKPPGGMETMKTDMGGAAAVIAAMSVLKKLGVTSKVVSYTPMVENMPSGTAIRPGDVLTMRNKKTVEVLNTDAEGRLILADALSLAVEAKPDAIIDLATLTGACMVALGDKIAGLMGTNEAWVQQIRDAAERAGEPVWPLPLPAEYEKQLESEIADLKNIGGSYGGALTAGLFLKAFAGEGAWAHLDIAGPARANADDGELVKGGTGFGVRTLVELATNFTAPKKA
jgi:leucyl aminopeptidase